MKMNKRVLTAFVMIVVLTFSGCGIVGVTAAPAPMCTWVVAPATGKVGESITFWLFSPQLSFANTQRTVTISGPVPATISVTWNQQATGVNAEFTYTFTQAGSYILSTPDGCELRPVAIIITDAATTTKSELTGPATGAPGDTLTYTVTAQTCDATGNCGPPGSSVNIRLVVGNVNTGTEAQYTGTTDLLGKVTIAVPFQTAGSYNVMAMRDVGGYTSNSIAVTIAAAGVSPSPSGIPTTSISPSGTPTTSISPSSSTATSAATTNATALSQGQGTSGSANSSMDAIWWLLGIAGIIILIIIGFVLYSRRREFDEGDKET